MPSPNTIRSDSGHAYYYVYARGINKEPLFIDKQDFCYFLGLFARYISKRNVYSSAGVPYATYWGELELLAYCLMNNHFHIFVYQVQQGALTGFMRGVMTSYSRYFNFKYKRRGAVFESRFKAALIMDEAYLLHITRYIHLNPRYWRRYPYSSLQYYLATAVKPEWLHVKRVQHLFGGNKNILLSILITKVKRRYYKH
ncbi:MAG TPA: transposase [Candidatus Saccharimonadales bacterium]|nr:transposase [Candidatus Saccharimonadales bacterium]